MSFINHFNYISYTDYICLKYKPAPDIHVMYEDQPYSDFKSLFLMANGGYWSYILCL